jgi:hypothetical protein
LSLSRLTHLHVVMMKPTKVKFGLCFMYFARLCSRASANSTGSVDYLSVAIAAAFAALAVAVTEFEARFPDQRESLIDNHCFNYSACLLLRQNLNLWLNFDCYLH